MHHEVLTNTPIHPWTGGKSPLHHALYKQSDAATPQSVNSSGNGENSSIDPPYMSYPDREYGGKHPRVGGKHPSAGGGGKAIGKKIPPDNPLLTMENVRQGHNLAASKLPFLWKLHEMLDDVEKTGDDHIVSWFDHGLSFRVHKPKSFVQKIIPYYFNQSKYKSFQRQLHLYEFTRITRGPEAGAYSHPKFIRGMKSICLSLSPKKIKGKRYNKKNKTQKNVVITTARPTNEITPQASTSSGDVYYPSNRTRNYNNAFLGSPFWTVDGGKESAECMDEEGSMMYNKQAKQDNKLDDDPKQWITKLRQMLVTGASLAAQLEEKSQTDEYAAPHQGDMVYVFGGMPFRYIDKNKSENEGEEELVDDLSECGESIASSCLYLS